MKKLTISISIAFIISLCIHFLLYSTVDLTIKKQNLQISTTNQKQVFKKNGFVNIKYVKIKKPTIVKKKKIIEKKQQKKIEPLKRIKKVINKKIPKRKRKKTIKKKIKTIKLPEVTNQIDLKSLFTLNKQQKEQNKKEQQSKFEESQKKTRELQEIQKLDKLTQSYIKLYGEKYFQYSKVQKRYLRNNLNSIGRVTQKYLSYPRLSIRTRQSGINIVEFLLHPNGDITNLKISDSSSYTALDKNTLKTISLAYKDYPKPLETVKIKIYVKYILR